MFLKRLFDFFFSILGIIILIPIYIIISCLIITFSGLPIFFLQCRVGKNEEMRATRRRRVIYRRRGHKVRISRACLDANVVQATPHLHVTFPASTRHPLVLERRAGDAPFTRHLQALHATFPHPLVSRITPSGLGSPREPSQRGHIRSSMLQLRQISIEQYTHYLNP